MSAAPWSVKGIDPKAREVAKDLARRSGLTLGEWLNSMIMEDDDDDVIPMPRRSQQIDGLERRGRSRRFDDAYSQDEVWLRVSASVDALASRLEVAERRSTAAIQGVDQAVAGLLQRLDGQELEAKVAGRRVEEIAEELREGHRRLRHFEKEVAPQTAESFGKVETSIGQLASRLYDIEERQRQGVNELRQRMDAVETGAPGPGGQRMSEVGQRLDEAQVRTSEALRSLERSFATLDLRLRDAESRIEPESSREAARFEKLAESLSRQVETSRAEMLRRLDTAEAEGRLERIERAVQAMGDQVRSAEERSAKAVESMGQEILRIAQNLNGRVARIEDADDSRLEQLGQGLTRKVQAEVARSTEALAQSVEQRLTAVDDRHALALERLGGEITRISDRLSERIAQTERRSAEALEDIGRRLLDSSSKIEQRYDRSSSELAERMRQSEERTAALIAEARQNIERRGDGRAAPMAAAYAEAEPDWRAAAFPDTAFPEPGPFSGATFPDPAPAYESDPVVVEQRAWSEDLSPPQPEPALEPTEAEPVFAEAVEPAPAPFGSVADAEPPVVMAAAPQINVPFGAGFGGADVSDALAATNLMDDADEFDGETEFVDARVLRAAAAKGRADSTRQAVSAARAAIAQSEPAETPAEAPRSAFGLKRGGKSKLQERIDRQTGASTIRKALGASAVAVALAGGGAVAFNELAAGGDEVEQTSQPIAALATTSSASAEAAKLKRGEELYQQAIAQLDQDDAKGPETLKAAAEQGLPQAQLHLASLYQDGGKGVEPSPTQARLWAKRAAETGDARGMHAYGMYLFDGVGGSPAPAAALGWLKRAAEKGLVDSQFNVAKLYEGGDAGIPANPGEAFKWYLIAARAGDADAQAAVERLRATLPATTRGEARAAADRFQVEPIV